MRSEVSMRKHTAILALCIVAMVVVLVFSQPTVAHADMGPKPSINITFDTLGDGTYYATILSKYRTTGPYQAYDPESDYKDLGNFDSEYYFHEDYVNEEAEMSWQAFVDYEDADGFYFLQLGWKVDAKANSIKWGYYPPYTFKVLLYLPDSNTYLSSGIYERYAYDSYYIADVANMEIAEIRLVENYDYWGEIIGFLCRVTLTIAVEMLIALIFGIKGRRAILTILIVNCVTQIGLNVALNLIYVFSGLLAYLVAFVFLEIGVAIVEAVAYAFLLRKAGVPIWKSIIYALVANVATAFAGFYLADWLPGMF